MLARIFAVIFVGKFKKENFLILIFDFSIFFKVRLLNPLDSCFIVVYRDRGILIYFLKLILLIS